MLAGLKPLTAMAALASLHEIALESRNGGFASTVSDTRRIREQEPPQQASTIVEFVRVT